MTVYSRKSSVCRNSVLMMFGQLAPMLSAIVCMPHIARALGTERLGILSLVWVIVGYFSILDLGLGRAVTRAVADALGKQEIERVPSIFWSAATLQIILGATGGVLLAALSPVVAVHVFHTSGNLLSETRSSFMLAALSLPVVLLSASIIGLLQAAQRFDLANRVRVPIGIANYALPVFCARLWPSLSIVVAVLIVTRVLSLVCLFCLANRVFPGLMRRQAFDAKEFRSLISFGGWVTVSSLISPLLVNADRLILGNLLSMSAVAHYSVPLDAVSRLHLIPGSVVAALFPVFSSETDFDDEGYSNSLALRSLRILLCLLGIPVVFLMALSSDIMRLWMGAEFAHHSSVALAILSIGILINGLATVPYTLLQARGYPSVTAKLHLVELPLHMALCFALTRAWGVNGTAVAWTLRVTIDAVLLSISMFRFTSVSPRSLLQERILSTLGGVLIFGLFLAFGARLCTIPGLRITGCMVAITLMTLSLWARVLDGDDRIRFRSLLSSPLRSRSS